MPATSFWMAAPIFYRHGAGNDRRKHWITSSGWWLVANYPSAAGGATTHGLCGAMASGSHSEKKGKTKGHWQTILPHTHGCRLAVFSTWLRAGAELHGEREPHFGAGGAADGAGD